MIVKDQPVAMQAKIYLYDLNNCARENGFKPDECWEISRATNDEKMALEKKYQLTLSARVMPETLAELFILVKSKLGSVNKANKGHEGNDVANSSDQQYLVAFNPNRLKN